MIKAVSKPSRPAAEVRLCLQHWQARLKLLPSGFGTKKQNAQEAAFESAFVTAASAACTQQPASSAFNVTEHVIISMDMPRVTNTIINCTLLTVTEQHACMEAAHHHLHTTYC
jgi:hypothetical protein